MHLEISMHISNIKITLQKNELNNRSERVSRLNSEIKRVKKPVHSCWGFLKEDKMMYHSRYPTIKTINNTNKKLYDFKIANRDYILKDTINKIIDNIH